MEQKRIKKPVGSSILCFSRLCSLSSVGISSYTANPKPIEKLQYPIGNKESRGLDVFQESFFCQLCQEISGLMHAYINMQDAHIPYDPKKIKLADDQVVSKLQTLSSLKNLYIQRLRKKPMLKPYPLPRIEEQQRLLEKLQCELSAKETQILHLTWELEELDMKNSQLLLKEDHLPCSCNEKPTLNSLTEAYNMAYKSIHCFTKHLMSLMIISGWDLNAASISIAGATTYSKRSHKKYAFASYLSRAMFTAPHGHSNFRMYCRSKYLMAVSPKMEQSFFGNLYQRNLILSNGNPRTPFYEAFIRMAKCTWALQVVANSFPPRLISFM